jgi:multiple sugar transport system permease protein
VDCPQEYRHICGNGGASSNLIGSNFGRNSQLRNSGKKLVADSVLFADGDFFGGVNVDFNDLLTFLRLPTYNWLGDPAVALPGIALMNIWSTAPFYMVIYLAALQDVPQSLYEAARLDGANSWQQFRYITLPILKPVTFFVMAIGTIGTFQLFDQSYIFSGGTGGPNNATLTVVLLIYQSVFRNLQMGYGAAIACLLAVAIVVLTLMQRRLFGGET